LLGFGFDILYQRVPASFHYVGSRACLVLLSLTL